MSEGFLYQRFDNALFCRDDKKPTGRCPLHFTTPHLHKEMELILYYEGKTIAYADSDRYELHPGDIYLAFPNQIHCFETIEQETYLLFRVKYEMLPELSEIFQHRIPKSAVIPNATNHPRIRWLADTLFNLWKHPEESPLYQQLLQSYTLAFFSEILNRMELIGMQFSDSSPLRAIVSYCSANYMEDLSLAVLEEQLHLNRYYISHLLNDKLGLRFNDYINSLRLSEACLRLVHSDSSITSIADQVGFSTLRTFNRAFIKQLGISPSEYRKNNAKKESK